MTVLWQQAAWLWPGPSTSAITSFTSSSSLSSLNLINPTSSFVPGEIAATNNTAEFIALLEGLRIVNFLGIKRLVIQGDSQLILKLITGEFIAHKPHLQLLVQAAIALLTPLDEWSARHVPRNLNSEADALCAKGFELGESIDVSTLIQRYACSCEISGAVSGASFVRTQGKINDSMIGNNTSLIMTATSNDIIKDSLNNVEVVIAPVWFHIASSLQGKNVSNNVVHLSTMNSNSLDKIEQNNTNNTKEEGMNRFFQMLGLQ
jgi:ribonuclease HI